MCVVHYRWAMLAAHAACKKAVCLDKVQKECMYVQYERGFAKKGCKAPPEKTEHEDYPRVLMVGTLRFSLFAGRFTLRVN